MQIVYNDKSDLLYIRWNQNKQEVTNKRVSEDIVLDLGLSDKIVGIEIMNASHHMNLSDLLPVQYGSSESVA